MNNVYRIFFIILLLTANNIANASLIAYGSITLNRHSGSFSFGGDGFNVTGRFGEGNWGPQHYPKKVGESISVNGVQSGNDFFGGGSATVLGNTFNPVNWGSLLAMGPSNFFASGPDIKIDSITDFYTGSFSFTGALCGTTNSSGECTVKLRPLTGSGSVRVKMLHYETPIGTLMDLESATYTFSPVPIPTAIWLFSSALVGLGIMRKRKEKVV